MARIKAFLDDTAQIIGPSFDFDQKVTGRSDRERKIARFVLDKAREVYEGGEKLGGVKPLGFFQARLEHKVYQKKYSKNAEGPDKAEVEAKMAAHKMPKDADFIEVALREKLVEMGNRLVEEDLVQGTWGNLSVRLNDRTMLVTPSGIDYANLRPQDMVRVNINSLEYGADELKPTSERGLHAAIYKANPEIRAIIHTHSTYACVYAACEQDMVIPPEYTEAMAIFGKKVRCAEYAFAGTDKLAANTAKAFGSGRGAIMSHHGMIVGGSDLEIAFSNAVLLEETARLLIQGRV